ncbi:coiled-coil domain-containing protein 88B-like [Polyodon spathula]|uniref:coiled-coil domain-containing protein 88B-like n=1 Tax=Polyodon spathula TaxID=7913 RepID=UPI001B7F6A0E|nr:coiled-coil domain-containing protein 88B-like [Polyodon spathula]
MLQSSVRHKKPALNSHCKTEKYGGELELDQLGKADRWSSNPLEEAGWVSWRRSGLVNEVEHLEQQLQRGYQQEAQLLHTSLEDLKRRYLLRLQVLESELSEAEQQRDRARREREAALAERVSLVQENRYLLRTLRGVREALEQREEQAYQAEKESKWKRVQNRAHWRRY